MMDKQEQIRQAVKDFVKGGDDNDTTLLERVLHPAFQNIQDGFFDDTGIFVFSKAEYVQLVSTKRFGGSARTIEFVSMDDLENAAVVKVRLESNFLKFTSYIVLVCSDGEWQVINNLPKIEVKVETPCP